MMKKTGLSLSEDDLKALLTAEYISSRSAKTTYEEAQEKMQQLLKICRRYWRDQDGNLCQDPKRLQLESIFLVKFLMEKGGGRMIIQNWNFTLLDTGFFRTGQPFHAGEGGYSRITSCFPPPMSTLQGAIRTALAAAWRWRPGNSDWPEELGDTDSSGPVVLQGPIPE
jgi:hypothetical protein